MRGHSRKKVCDRAGVSVAEKKVGNKENASVGEKNVRHEENASAGEKNVRDWMHEGVISCRRETPVEEVARTMETEDISALVVVDDQGDAVGVISRTDLVNARFIQPYLKHWRGMTAEHLMSNPVISVSPDTSINEAARRLHEKRIHRLVVVEELAGHIRPIGILSVTDLAKHAGD
jgi:CBS domain-containing protein